MVNGPGRWAWLTFLAVVNLLLWVGLACLVGLGASDRLDLGLETLARQGQAAAVAAWERAVVSRPSRLASPAPAGAAWPTAVQVAPRPTDTGEPAMEVVALALHETSLAGPPVPTLVAAPVVELTAGTPATDPAGPPAAVQAPPVESLKQPLLLADPPIQNVVALDAEMQRSAPGRAVQIRYGEEALNREVAALWRNNPDLPYRDVQIDLQPTHVVLKGVVTVLGFQVRTTVMGSLLAHDCQPQLEIQTLSLAGVLTPRLVRDEVEKMVLEAVAWYPADYSLCVEQIVLEESKVTLYGHHR